MLQECGCVEETGSWCTRCDAQFWRAQSRRRTRRSWRVAVRRRDMSRCQYCGITCSKNVPVDDERFMTFDHIIPTSRGGHRTSEVNVVVCCAYCNQQKGDRMPWECGMWPRNGLAGCWGPKAVDSDPLV